MICSGVALRVIALSRLSVFEPDGNVTPGLMIATLGLLINGWFWWRYTALGREQSSPIIAAQQQLYRAKAYVDLCVVVALSAVVVASTHPATRYVDILGSVIVSGYLLWNGIRSMQAHLTQSKSLLQEEL
jgi:divalent metal cation (Fe/Co/Zn/Cd) transporter